MGMLEELKELGVNVKEGKNRLMGNTALYERMLVKAADMMKKAPVSTEYDGTDCAELIERTHAIKGATGNLSLTPLYNAYSEIVRLLREDQPEQAKQVFEEVLPIQNKIVDCIEKYAGS